MQLYFNSTAGAVDGSFNTAANYFEDVGHSTPHGSTASGSDGVIMQTDATDGSLTCAHLDGGGFQVNSGAIAITCTSCSNVVWTAGISNTNPLLATNCTFAGDPSAGITGEGNTYAANLAGTITFASSGTFGAGITLSGGMNCAGTIAWNTNTGSPTVFTGGGAINYTGTIPAGSTFSGPVVFGASCASDITAGSLTVATFTGNQAGGTVYLKGATVDYNAASTTGGTIDFNTFGATMTIGATLHTPYGLLSVSMPPANKVLPSAGGYGVGGLVNGNMSSGGFSDGVFEGRRT